MKKIFGFAAVVSMVAVASVRMSSNNNEELTALQLENIEALAQDEGGLGKGTLYGNSAGTRFCCASTGSRDCGAAPCPW